ncbi:MAG: PAS domain S-box-containing protein, partial [Sulfurimonas sp.]|uniref:PAS domain-containing protein n=1 Tax=Sulfurimonas sp. TaxID=2022749 RepID=UPI0039E307A7
MKKNELYNQINMLTSVIDSTPDLIFYKDYLNCHGKYISCNNAFSEFVGKNKHQIINHTDIELFGEELGAFFRLKDAEMMHRGETVLNEEWVSYPDGTRVLLSTSKTPYIGEDGLIIGVVGVSRNITQNYESNKETQVNNSELSKSKKRLEEVFEASGEGIWDWNIHTNQVEHNNTWYEILGLNKDKDFIKDFTTLIHPEDKENVLKKINDTIKGNSKNYNSEHRLFQKNGEVVWVIDKGRIVERNDEGMPLRMAGSFSVITDRKKVEAELVEHHQYLQSIIDGVNDSIMVIREDYTIEIMDKAFEKSL